MLDPATSARARAVTTLRYVDQESATAGHPFHRGTSSSGFTSYAGEGGRPGLPVFSSMRRLT
jgi:hypothetical protein